MTFTEEVLANNQRYAETFSGPLPLPPSKHLAVVACMDARLDVEETLGLRTGDAHIVRNAGGLVTDDVIRSLIVSMELLGTQEIVLIGHTQCGLHDVDEDRLKERVAAQGGVHPSTVELAFGGFGDLKDNVRRQVAILRAHPYLRRVPVHGLIFDVSNGRLTEVA